MANVLADRSGCEAIDAEHVMLAMITENRLRHAAGGAATQVLELMAVDVPSLTRELTNTLAPSGGKAPVPAKPRRLPQTARFKVAIEASLREGASAGDEHAGTEHLLLGLLTIEDGPLPRMLSRYCVARTHVLEAIARLRDRPKLDDP